MQAEIGQPDAVREQLALELGEAGFDLRAHDDGHAREHVPLWAADGVQEGEKVLSRGPEYEVVARVEDVRGFEADLAIYGEEAVGGDSSGSLSSDEAYGLDRVG